MGGDRTQDCGKTRGLIWNFLRRCVEPAFDGHGGGESDTGDTVESVFGGGYYPAAETAFAIAVVRNLECFAFQK
jgi:hypothetical protein